MPTDAPQQKETLSEGSESKAELSKEPTKHTLPKRFRASIILCVQFRVMPPAAQTMLNCRYPRGAVLARDPLDPNSGRSYYRARYYDPGVGRFISEDPIRFLGGLNFYEYVQNNPTRFIDPLGLCEATGQTKACLEKLFNEPIGGVKIDEKVDPKASYTATTRKNLIIIKTPCKDFLADSETLLEEYYHVLRQWNTGRLTRLGYAWEYLKHGYDNNIYEIEAKKFAKDQKGEYEKCLTCSK